MVKPEKTNKIDHTIIKEQKFIGTLHLLGKTYIAEAATIEEVIDKLKVGNWVKTKSVLSIEHYDGGEMRSRERILNSRLTRQLFGATSPTQKMVAIKWIKSLFL